MASRGTVLNSAAVKRRPASGWPSRTTLTMRRAARLREWMPEPAASKIPSAMSNSPSARLASSEAASGVLTIRRMCGASSAIRPENMGAMRYSAKSTMAILKVAVSSRGSKLSPTSTDPS